jgi:prepilin-type N-terminal cleavage/methylation domain-containing protein
MNYGKQRKSSLSLSLCDITLNRGKGFTLVEILVVIAIVGLLGSIIFAITSGADEQGRIAKGLYFSQHLRNSLGAYAVGIWNFDEGSGTLAEDTSGWGNDGTLVGSPVWRCASVDSSYTPSGQGCSLEFDGVSAEVNVGNNTSLDSGQGSYTVEMWLKIFSYPSTYDFPFSNGRNPNWVNTKISSGGSLSFELKVVDSGIYISKSYGILQLDKWYHVVFVINRDSQTAYFIVDGVKSTDSETNISSLPDLSSAGNYRFSSPSVFGLIDEVRIYSRALTASEIQQRYAESAPKYHIAQQNS